MERASTARRVTTWALVALHGLVASGLPLPLAAPTGSNIARAVAGKDRSRPFPCMDTPCGCATAEQCFTRCCCRTPAETLRWAAARGIEPAVIAALDRRTAAAPTAPAGGCCAAAKPSCCDAASSSRDDDDAVGGVGPATTAVTLRAMLACDGVIGELLGADAAGSLPPPRVSRCPAAARGPRVPCLDERSLRRPTEPAVPPPRGC